VVYFQSLRFNTIIAGDKTVMQWSKAMNSPLGLRVFNGMVHIARTEGSRALFRGLTPSILGVAPLRFGMPFELFVWNFNCLCKCMNHTFRISRLSDLHCNTSSISVI
jgi:hypothetical protein